MFHWKRLRHKSIHIGSVYFSQTWGSSKLRISPTRCRLPVQRTWTWSADFTHSGRPCIDTSVPSPFKSLASRPRETQIRLSAIQLKVIVGIGPLSDGFWSFGACCSVDAAARWEDTGTETVVRELWLLTSDMVWEELTRSNQTERLSAQRRNWSSRVTFMFTTSEQHQQHHHHHHHQHQQQHHHSINISIIITILSASICNNSRMHIRSITTNITEFDITIV